MAADLLKQWYRYIQLLIVNHGKIYAAGLLAGWLYRLSKNDPQVRHELAARLAKEEEIHRNN